eukprot:s288_g41.t1
MAQEAVVREGEASRILDLLYCDVLFDDWEKMLSAWCFLETRVEHAELREIEIVRTRDSFASAQAGVRCAEMVVKINQYFATIRLFEASLTKLESQVDDVHHLAERAGLVMGSLQVDPLLMSGRQARQSRLVVVVVALLRISSLLAATYLGGQYFVRYSPPFIRSNLPQRIRDAFALKQTVEPSDGRVPEVATSESGGWFEDSLLRLLPSIFFSLPYLALMIVLLSDLRRCGSSNIRLKLLRLTQLLYEEYFGIEGKLYDSKVAMLQVFTVMLQAFGKLQIMGGLVSFAFHSAPKHSGAFERCFWAFVGFLCLNSIYPTILLAFPSVKWVRRGAAMMDAVLDIAYTSTYLIITLLAIYELQLDQSTLGNFGDEASLNFQAELDPAFAFPSDFLGFFAVYYSLAHVCTVCRALERTDRLTYWKKLQSLPSSASRSLLRPSRFSRSKRCRICCKELHVWYSIWYSPCLLGTILNLLLYTHFYPIHAADFKCFPCRCEPKDNGTKHLASCSLVGVLRLKDMSLSYQGITSIAEDAFASSRSLQRLSLSGNRLYVIPENITIMAGDALLSGPFNRLSVLPKKLFAPLDCLQLLDLGRLGLQHLESDTFIGLSNLRILSLSENRLKVLPEGLLRPMPALEQLLLGGKTNEKGASIVLGNKLSLLPQEILRHSPQLQVLDLSENQLNSLPKDIFDKTPLLRMLDLGSNNLTELSGQIFSGLSNLEKLEINSNKLHALPAEVFSGLSNLEKLKLNSNKLRALPAEVFSGLSNLQELDLSVNLLSNLPPKVFAGLGNLKRLDLFWNKLRELPAEVFAGLRNLQRLDLRYNGLRELPSEVFAGLSKLEVLDLFLNRLNELPAEVWGNLFTELSNLQGLSLGWNKLSELPTEIWANLFAELRNLWWLDLSGNDLGELPAEVCGNLFTGLSSLQVLKLSSNELNELPAAVWANMLSGLHKLQELDLSFNNLKELPAICSIVKCINY